MTPLLLALALAQAPALQPPPGGAEPPGPPPPVEAQPFSPQDVPRGPGYVRLTVESPLPASRLSVYQGGPVEVWEDSGRHERRAGELCGPPCHLTLQARPGTRLRFGGGYHYSDDFSLAGLQGDWVATVRPDDPGRSSLSLVVLCVGAMALPLGPALLLRSDRAWRERLPWAGAISGAAALTVGVGYLLWVTNPTTFALRPLSPEPPPAGG